MVIFMSYVEAKVFMNNCIEVYKYYSGRIGKKIYNAPSQRKTPLKQIKYQDKKATRVCGWKIAENFEVVNESLQYGIQISIDDKDTSGTTRYWSSTIGEKDPTTGMTNDVAWSYSFGERTPYCEGANSQYSLKYVLAF